jgi:hypothetical protein
MITDNAQRPTPDAHLAMAKRVTSYKKTRALGIRWLREWRVNNDVAAVNGSQAISCAYIKCVFPMIAIRDLFPGTCQSSGRGYLTREVTDHEVQRMPCCPFALAPMSLRKPIPNSRENKNTANTDQ